MNISPQFVKSPNFIKFKRRVGDKAMEHLVLIGLYCQQGKNPVIMAADTEDLEIIADCEDGEMLLEIMLQTGMLEAEGAGQYRCLFFEEMNNQLISNWRNGAMKAKQSKSTQSNPKQTNSIQLNSTECLGTASSGLGITYDDSVANSQYYPK